MLNTAKKAKNELDFQIIEKKRNGRPSSFAKAISITKNKNGQGASSTVIRLSADLMKKARFIVGDKVVVGVRIDDGKRQLMLRRCNDSPNAYTMSSVKSDIGKATNCSIKISSGGAIDEFVGLSFDVDDVCFESINSGVLASEK